MRPFLTGWSAGKNIKVLPALFSTQTSVQYDRSATKEIACNLELLPFKGNGAARTIRLETETLQ